ncbi:polysaccharide lyase family 1 protein [Epilithonimonas zeae]|uniref:pectate lyase family protein n=1 Tax=Epilithonimonas zeae TaxID=1416779 RepID=UPI00200C9C74|nr:hypothetical protein [Epilithonimonas zeae]UQB69271.1 hypothetical protein KI430_02225 [Epilithonimonas zeae]
MKKIAIIVISYLSICCQSQNLENARTIRPKTIAFPGAEGFGKFAKGARASAKPEVYIVSNLNDRGKGSFRDAVSQPGRFVVFSVDGIVELKSPVTVSKNITIAGQTAPGKGIFLYGEKVSFSGADDTIARYLKIRLGNKNKPSNNTDASGISNGKNIMLDHLSISWSMDEVFSINWDKRGTEPDSITLQNSIIAQGLHLYNHSAGGLIQTNGSISIIKSLYASNKTRNPKVKGKNEFVNNIIYNFGNLGNKNGHTVSGDGYIMGGSVQKSEVNIINNYFIGGPLTLEDRKTPFSRGTNTFHLYESGNYFDNNKNGILDGQLVPHNSEGFPGETPVVFMDSPFQYPFAKTDLSATQAFDDVIKNAGASFPKRDDVDELIISEVQSLGKKGIYVFTENDLPLSNNGIDDFLKIDALKDSDSDGIPDVAELKMGLDPNDSSDALKFNKTQSNYLNIEVYVNDLVR